MVIHSTVMPIKCLKTFLDATTHLKVRCRPSYFECCECVYFVMPYRVIHQ